MRTITDEAADMLQILASQPEHWPWFASDLPGNWRPSARDLARSMFNASDEGDGLSWRECYAEAEARLRMRDV